MTPRLSGDAREPPRKRGLAVKVCDGGPLPSDVMLGNRKLIPGDQEAIATFY